MSETAAQEKLFRAFLRSFGIDMDDPHLRDTPKRVVAMYKELLSGYPEPDFKFTTFPVTGTPNLVTVTGIEYYSLCSHHVIPFLGVAHISYLPDKKLCGLSKLARVVKHFASRLQVQEELTEQVAGYLEEKLKPDAIAVIMTGEHLCMSMRGVKSPHHKTTTSAMRGKFIVDVGLKEEFFQVIQMSGGKNG